MADAIASLLCKLSFFKDSLLHLLLSDIKPGFLKFYIYIFFMSFLDLLKQIDVYFDVLSYEYFFLEFGITPISRNIVNVLDLIIEIEFVLVYLIYTIFFLVLFLFSNSTVKHENGHRYYNDASLYNRYSWKENSSANFRARLFSTFIEIAWTVSPAFILLIIGVPSLVLLYCMDAPVNPSFIVKVIGHQWYWTYEYSDLSWLSMYVGKNFDMSSFNYIMSVDSYLIKTDGLLLGEKRLFDVDNRLVLFSGSHIKLIVTSNDVIHSFAVPALGIKIDAIPGRINEVSVFIDTYVNTSTGWF